MDRGLSVAADHRERDLLAQQDHRADRQAQQDQRELTQPSRVRQAQQVHPVLHRLSQVQQGLPVRQDGLAQPVLHRLLQVQRGQQDLAEVAAARQAQQDPQAQQVHRVLTRPSQARQDQLVHPVLTQQ